MSSTEIVEQVGTSISDGEQCLDVRAKWRAKVDDPRQTKISPHGSWRGMFSKSAEPRSIASQLVILFTLAAAFLLCCGLGVLYWIFVRHAVEEDNAVLADKISSIRGDLKKAGDAKALNEELKVLHVGERAAYWVRVMIRRWYVESRRE